MTCYWDLEIYNGGTVRWFGSYRQEGDVIVAGRRLIQDGRAERFRPVQVDRKSRARIVGNWHTSAAKKSGDSLPVPAPGTAAEDSD